MSLKTLFALSALALLGLAQVASSAPVSTAVLTGYQGYFQPAVTTTITASGATSAAIPLKGFVPVGIYLPATFTGTTLTFTACDTAAGTYLVLKNTTSGTSLSYTVAQGTYVALDPKDFAGVNFLKLVSGSTEGSTRTLKIALKGL